MLAPLLAIINPKAGVGQSENRALKIVDELRQSGVDIDLEITKAQGDGSKIALESYKKGTRHFIAIGGDGTTFEILNGLYPYALSHDRPTLSLIPTGTGNSFIREFIKEPRSYSAENFLNAKNYDCDVIKLKHSEGELYFINLLAIGFASDVVDFRNRYLNTHGNSGYIFSVLIKILTFEKFYMMAINNSRYTGGPMLIAPAAKIDDGYFDVIEGSNLSRLTLLKLFLQIYKGTHIDSPLIKVRREKTMDLNFKESIPVMIDGNIVHIKPLRLEILSKRLIVRV